jgi:hypothetical protein
MLVANVYIISQHGHQKFCIFESFHWSSFHLDRCFVNMYTGVRNILLCGYSTYFYLQLSPMCPLCSDASCTFILKRKSDNRET